MENKQKKIYPDSDSDEGWNLPKPKEYHKLPQKKIYPSDDDEMGSSSDDNGEKDEDDAPIRIMDTNESKVDPALSGKGLGDLEEPGGMRKKEFTYKRKPSKNLTEKTRNALKGKYKEPPLSAVKTKAFSKPKLKVKTEALFSKPASKGTAKSRKAVGKVKTEPFP